MRLLNWAMKMAEAIQRASFGIIDRQDFSEFTHPPGVHHPSMAGVAKPGQFVIVMSHEAGERIALTIADFDRKNGMGDDG
jgi:ferredoxin--NADP+ reductase